MFTCKGCLLPTETQSNINKLFCNNNCYWKYRRQNSGTSTLPGTKPKKLTEDERRQREKQRLQNIAIKALNRKNYQKEYRTKRRKIVMNHYGGAKCNCCGETTYEFLQIDHIQNDGNVQRKIDPTQNSLVDYLIKHNFPSGFQILCANCNFVKRFGNTCPHKAIGGMA